MFARSEKALLAAVAAALIISGTAATVWAMSCLNYYEMENWHLQLVEVTVDGETVDNFSDYHNLHFTLVARNDRNHMIVSKDRYTSLRYVPRDDPSTYGISMDAGRIPENFEDYLSDEGGAQ